MRSAKSILLFSAFPWVLLFSQKISSDKVLSAKAKLAFVEEHSLGDGILDGDFGDIVLFDLQSKLKYYVTNDKYLDLSPCLSPDGRYILFASKRVGGSAVLGVQGIAGRKELYVFDTVTKSTRRFAESIQKKYPRQMYEFDGLVWPTQKSIIFSQDNELFLLSADEDSLWRLASVDSNSTILNLSPSPKDHLIAFSHMNSGSPSWTISLFDMQRDSVITILKRQKWTEVFGWTPNGNALLISGPGADTSFILYRDSSKKLQPIFVPGEGAEFNSSQAVFASNSTIIVRAERLPRSSQRTDLFLFDMNTHKIQWLTDDPYNKEYLSVPLPSK